MIAFRLLALTYALVAILIAPAWLTADDEVPPAPTQAAGQAVEGPDAPQVVESVPAPAGPTGEAAAEPPAAVAQEADEPAETGAQGRAAAKPKDGRKQRKAQPVAKAAASGSVTITDFEFTPKTITVNEGDTVTWTNKGPTPHTATAEDGSFDTGNLDKGESGSATFTSAGTIAYICTPHPFMTGKVVVRAAAAGDDGDSGSGTTGGGDDDGGATAGDAAASGDDSGDLPNTGGETLLIALLGLATLGAGLLLRRRGASNAR